MEKKRLFCFKTRIKEDIVIVAINYGMGNLYSISKALERMGAKVKVTNNPRLIGSANAIVLPGVGAFREAMKNLSKYEIVPVIKKAIEEGKPFLGICLGMQLLFSESEEGNCKGLDIIKGKVRRFCRTEKIPHMGWNQVKCKKEIPILKGLPDPCWMYFAHSYYVTPSTQNNKVIAANTDYGVEFASIIWKQNVFGTQFHPEKSGKDGVMFLKNFIKIAGERCRRQF